MIDPIVRRRPTLWQRLRLAIRLDDSSSPNVIARRFLRENAPTYNELIDLVAPLVEREIASIRRAGARTVEDYAFRSPGLSVLMAVVPESDQSKGEPRTLPDRLRELLKTSFHVPGSKTVDWGSATIEQHRERRDWLRRFAVSTLDTAQRHQQAMDLILENDVTCLNDLT